MDEQEKEATERRPARKASPSTAETSARLWQALRAALAAWTVDGDPSARPTLTIFAAGPKCFKAVLNDKRTGLQLWSVSTSIPGVIDALDETLERPEVPWETGQQQGGIKALVKHLFGASRPALKSLE